MKSVNQTRSCQGLLNKGLEILKNNYNKCFPTFFFFFNLAQIFLIPMLIKESQKYCQLCIILKIKDDLTFWLEWSSKDDQSN